MIPPKSILAAVDFSDSSRVALDFAARLARHSGATLHVLHAEEPLLAAAANASGIDLTRETREELAQFAHAVQSAAGLPLHYHVATGRSATTICNAAAREQADLIVVGMHGMSGPARSVFGSTTEGVLRAADTSVLVVPNTWVPPRADSADLSGMGPVVAAIESTEPAVACAAAACRLAAILGTSVDLLHVVPELPVLDKWRAHAEAVVSLGIEQARRELTGVLPLLGATVPVALRVESGPVAQSIAAAVTPTGERHPILVLGRRTRARRLGAPGTTAYRVLTLTRVPLLLCLPDS